MRTLLCSLVCLSGICGQALAAPSRLNIIPTADVLDRGVISLETESAGAGRLWGADCDRFALFQTGIGNGIELGVDRCLDDPVDYTSGDENSLTYGVALALSEQLGLTLARTEGNSPGTDDGHVANLAWSVGWK